MYEWQTCEKPLGLINYAPRARRGFWLTSRYPQLILVRVTSVSPNTYYGKG